MLTFEDQFAFYAGPENNTTFCLFFFLSVLVAAVQMWKARNCELPNEFL